MKRFKIMENVGTQLSTNMIQDSEGNQLNISTTPFTDAQKDNLPKKIKVILEATHTGVNRNLVEYTHEGLASSVDSWTKDYNKPVLLNHDSHSDPLGRVTAAEYKQSVLDSEKYCIALELEITNADAIERFLDGRYKTFSIGGYSDSAKCSICGKDLMSDGWCGHTRGRKYGDKTCYWTLGKMDYVEISVVNCPADHNAQAISFTDENGNEIQAGSGNSDEVPQEKPEQNSEQTPEQTDSIQTQIDSYLGIGQPQTDGETPAVEEPQKDEEPAKQIDDQSSPEEQPQEDDEVQVLKDKIQALQDEIDQLKSDLTSKNETITELTTKNEQDAQQINELNDENKNLLNQATEMATFARQTMCKNLVDMQIMLGHKDEADRDTLMKEYQLLTTAKLEDSFKELSQKPTQRQHPVVNHPGIEQLSTDGEIIPEKKVPTIEDFAETMVNFLVHNRHM